ncbi:MAG: histidine kinase [Bacteroidota bacterium]
MSKTRLKNLGVRFLLINAVYLIVKLTMDHGEEGLTWFDPTGTFYYIVAVFLFFGTWEVNDWLIRKYQARTKGGVMDQKDHMAIVGGTLAIIVPVTALVYYLGIFELNHLCEIDTENPWLRWRIDFFRAILIGIAVIFFNLFYSSLTQKKELDKRMAELKKEVVTSKYKSLKNQISPHFLFNSLNTLTSLMYEDRDLASDFVTRLASCYRYILDNREEDLVSLEKELNFLDSFVFMMNVRHEGALSIKTEVTLDPCNYVIPTLTLQMLVENALKHNLYSKDRPMEIVVRSKGTQRLSIENTFRKRELKEASTGLGIKNIRKRYSFYTAQEIWVEQTGSLFIVEIPLLKKNIREIKNLSVS